MRKLRLTLIALVVLLVTGCQYFPSRNGGAVSGLGTHDAVELTRSQARQIAELLSYYRALEGLGEDRLRAHLARLQGDLEEYGCDTARLKSAMILSQLSAKESDPGAAAILGICLNDVFTQYSPEGKLALLLRDLIEARRAASRAQSEARNYHHETRALQDENQKLHKQLEGLKAIEQSIQQRNER
ncbi:MAG: hypothetical protein L0H73_15005 [Nitrococcus sp.]|nr:hypothetical protein [Nitrococcus sp.]